MAEHTAHHHETDKPLKVTPQHQQSTEAADTESIPAHVDKPTTSDSSKKGAEGDNFGKPHDDIAQNDEARD